MRRFTMFRRNVPTDTHNENQRNAPDEPQFEGVQFTDGRVAIRWMTAKKSTSCWDSMEDMLAIHGHPEYGSELVWSDEAPTRWDEQRNMPNFIPPSHRALDTQPKFGPAFNRKPPPPPPARHEGKGTDTKMNEQIDKPWWKYSIIALLIGIIIGSLITQALEVFFP